MKGQRLDRAFQATAALLGILFWSAILVIAVCIAIAVLSN